MHIGESGTNLAAEENLNLVFHCLADPTRRKIIGLLREMGEMLVGDIAKAFDMSLNGVSKHLKVLEKAGLITRRIEGRRHHISVSWNGLQAAFSWLHFHQHFWSTRLNAWADHIDGKKGESDE